MVSLGRACLLAAVGIAGIRGVRALPAPFPACRRRGAVAFMVVLARDLVAVQVGDHLGQPPVLLAHLRELRLKDLRLEIDRQVSTSMETKQECTRSAE